MSATGGHAVTPVLKRKDRDSIAMIFEYWFDPDSSEILEEYLKAASGEGTGA